MEFYKTRMEAFIKQDDMLLTLRMKIHKTRVYFDLLHLCYLDI